MRRLKIFGWRDTRQKAHPIQCPPPSLRTIRLPQRSSAVRVRSFFQTCPRDESCASRMRPSLNQWAALNWNGPMQRGADLGPALSCLRLSRYTSLLVDLDPLTKKSIRLAKKLVNLEGDSPFHLWVALCRPPARGAPQHLWWCASRQLPAPSKVRSYEEPAKDTCPPSPHAKSVLTLPILPQICRIPTQVSSMSLVQGERV